MTEHKEKALINFKKASSLTDKIIEMVKNDTYCINIMQQNLAVIGLLKSAHHLMMENHFNTCFKNVFETKSKAGKQRAISEILKVSKMANK